MYGLILGVVTNCARRRSAGGGRRSTPPPCRGARTDSRRSLEVGLVEAREHPLGVGGFELRVQIHLAVDWVDESVQALAGVRVVAVGVHHDHVVFGQAAQRDTGRLVVARHVEVAAVEGRTSHGAAAMSMTVSAPTRASNVTVVTERKVRSPGLPPPSVRSKSIR